VKRYTTKFLKGVALTYMAFPIAYLLVSALVFDIPAGQCMSILLNPSFYLLSLIAVISGYGLWEAKRWAWYLFLFANVFIGYANAIIAVHFSESHHTALAFILMTVGLIGVLFRVGREMYVPYFLPRIRWWESNPRYKLSIPTLIRRNDLDLISGEILDISMGGCFVKLKGDVPEHDNIRIRFMLFGAEIEVPGTVVWCTQSTVTHPKGIGIKFAPLPRHERRILRVMTRKLKEIGTAKPST
jgi:Tfp pilus assembly protein PilZ/uncharacterized membrane protein (DUF2068 family)